MRPVSIDTMTPPAAMPVTVEEFIDHARLNALTVDRQPALIARELESATERAIHYLRRSLITQRWRVRFVGETGTCNALILPRPPIQSVEKVFAGDAELPAEQYKLVGSVLIAYAPFGRAATVEYTAGYGENPADVPASIREGILEYATTVYERRAGDRDNKYQAAANRTLPAGVVDLWRPFQIELSG